MNTMINLCETYQKEFNNYKSDYNFEVNKNKIEHIKNFFNNINYSIKSFIIIHL